jgi:SSS family solute:Na+ symporter
VDFALFLFSGILTFAAPAQEKPMSVLIITLILLFILSALPGGRQTSAGGWLFAHRRATQSATLLSLIATTVGGSATIVLVAMVRTHGWYGLVYDIPVALGMLLLGLGFARFIRTDGARTVPELIGKRYGHKARKITAVFIVITEVAWFALLLKAIQVFLPPADNRWLLIVLTTGILIYITIGGQVAVYLTDKIQALMVAILISGLFLFLVMQPAMKIVPQTAPMPALQFTVLFIMMFLSGLSGPDILSRIFYARDSSAAGKGMTRAAIVKMLIAIVLAGFAWQSLGLGDAISSHFTAIPETIALQLPIAMQYLVFAIFITIMLSSADTVLMTAVTTFANEIQIVNSKVTWSRFIALGLGLTGLLLALYFQTILDVLKLAYAFYASGPALLVVAAYARLDLKAPQAAVLLSICGIVGLVLNAFWPTYFAGTLIIIAVFAIAAVMLHWSNRNAR